MWKDNGLLAVDATSYQILVDQLRSLIDGERDCIANLANASALLFAALPTVNWVGFYLATKAGDLVVGPFQGKPACVRIGRGKGVCGTAAANRETLVVPDVDDFPGHIACDAASRSEIVIPLVAGDVLYGVLDIDSAVEDRFHDVDRTFLEEIADLLVRGIDWTTICPS